MPLTTATTTPSNFSPYQPPRDERQQPQLQPQPQPQPQPHQHQHQQYRPASAGTAPSAGRPGALLAQKQPASPRSAYPPVASAEAAAPAQLPVPQHAQQQPRPGAKEAFPPRSYADDDFGNSYQAGAGVGSSSSSSGGLGGSGAGGYHALPAANAGGWDAGGGADRVRVNKYETTLPVRVDILAALAYALGPITGVLLLVFETANDYVRFHAWQSCLWFSAVLTAHFIFGLMSSFLGWLFLIGEIVTAAMLAYKAYQDGQSLDRFHLPYVGDVAARWVDSE